MRTTTWWVGVILAGVVGGCVSESGSTSAAGSAGGSGTGGAGVSAEACERFADVPPSADVLVRIVNQRGATVYVDTECGILFDIEAGGVTHPGASSDMQRTCFWDRTKPPACCDCAYAGTPIAPGESFEAHWTGLYHDPTEMPVACYANAGGLSAQTTPSLRSCVQPTPGEPGPMKLVAHVFQTSTGQGALWPSVSDPIPATKDFVLGVDGTVEVVVE